MFDDGRDEYENPYETGSVDAPKPKKPKKEGFGIGKFVGKCVAAGLIFGLVSSLTFSGTNSLIQSANGSEDSGSNATATPVLSIASADATDTTASDSTTVSTTALDVSGVVENVMPSIVSITSEFEATSQSYGLYGSGISGTYQAVGSGIIVGETDSTLYVVTNNHVIEDASQITVTFFDDANVNAEVKGTDPSNDLAVLSVNIADISSETLSAIKVATLGDSDSLSVGETAIAIGNALGYGQSVTTGVISALDRDVTIESVTSSLIQTDAAINPGNSGGALLNAKGELIGINSAKFSNTQVEGMGYAIPISTAIPIINELIEREAVDASEASYLGIGGVDVTTDASAYYGIPSGIYISQVFSGTAAEAGGIKQGDVITGFDGHAVSTMEELQQLMQYYAAGTTVDLTLQRSDGESYSEITLSVTLGAKSAAQ